MAHTTRITVSPDGRATIGEDVVGALGAPPGDHLLIETSDTGIVNVRVATRSGLDDFIGGLAAYATVPLTLDDIQDILEAGWASDR